MRAMKSNGRSIAVVLTLGSMLLDLDTEHGAPERATNRQEPVFPGTASRPLTAFHSMNLDWFTFGKPFMDSWKCQTQRVPRHRLGFTQD